ncbi:MAG: ketopantoate reductase family protein [Methylocystaceae bacterium]
MRILVAGAGAVGGYFGGRLVEKGEDVTFLLRPARKQQLETNGLIIKSEHGDYHSPIKTIGRDDSCEAFDLIIIAAKAYQLKDLMDDLEGMVGPQSKILPLLNGYAHYELMQQRWGQDKVLGGLCFIESTLGSDGEIRQTSPQHRITFGALTANGEREQAIANHLRGANFDLVLSDNVLQEIWMKYTYITCLAGITSLMRSPLGAIRENEWGWQVYQRLATEVTTIAVAAGFPVDETTKQQLLQLALNNHAGLKSSMQRDMEKGLAVEADHLPGYLLQLAVRQGSDPIADYPVLSTVYANLKIYETSK